MTPFKERKISQAPTAPAGWFVETCDHTPAGMITRQFWVALADIQLAEKLVTSRGHVARARYPLSAFELDQLKLSNGDLKELDYDE
jgi:hypothetical protein